MNINQNIENIINQFGLFEDWMDKYSFLIDMGKELEPMDESKKVDENLIKGCQSRVWLSTEYKDGKMYFHADSDAVITKGIAAMLLNVFSGCTPDEIANADVSFIDKLGLTEHLSPTRSNGLLSMIKQIKMYALAYKIIDKE